MVINSQTKVVVDTTDVRAFMRRVTAALRLEGQRFNLCFVDDCAVRQLNAEFRAKSKPTDVLSFPWRDGGPPRCRAASSRLLKNDVTPTSRSARAGLKPGATVRARLRQDIDDRFQPAFPQAAGSTKHQGRGADEFAGFLGDVVISAEMARRNAVSAGHSTRCEIRWLILHGVLHLLGYDHETDDGEMTKLELSMRDRLGIDAIEDKSKIKRQKSKGKKSKPRA
jgi:probable rRNA maturation factor